MADDMIDRIDHLVLTVRSVDVTCAFYERALGFRRVNTPDKPTALMFGGAKINVHAIDHGFEPKAAHPTPGSGDFCLITRMELTRVEERLRFAGVAIEQGPVARHGARGAMMSLYFRDPDANLVEVSRYGD